MRPQKPHQKDPMKRKLRTWVSSWRNVTAGQNPVATATAAVRLLLRRSIGTDIDYSTSTIWSTESKLFLISYHQHCVSLLFKEWEDYSLGRKIKLSEGQSVIINPAVKCLHEIPPTIGTLPRGRYSCLSLQCHMWQENRTIYLCLWPTGANQHTLVEIFFWFFINTLSLQSKPNLSCWCDENSTRISVQSEIIFH